MNFSKFSKIKTLAKLKKSGNFKIHMRNFNKQHFNMWEQETSKGPSLILLYNISSLTLFVLLLTIVILLYTLSTFYFKRIIGIFYYDIWFDVSTLLNQSDYWRSRYSLQECNFFHGLDDIEGDTRTPASLREAFAKIKVLSSIID